MKVLNGIGELDAMMAVCAASRTDDELRAVLSSFRMEPQSQPGLDPFSSAYREQQMELYRWIAGRQYALASEATPFDVEYAVQSPVPYSTGSCQTAGDHLVAVGEFLRHMRLHPGARVLEFGPGWGNLTLVLAALGYKVTCVDIESRFCDLIQRRADRLGLTLDVINADFSWAGGVTQPFDAVVFFECFHHAADHLQLLRDLHAAVKPGGSVYLGAEPILADFPVPWGLRLDGQSLWSIRKFGWMELGFQDSYFRAALDVTGWAGVRHPVVSPAIWELTNVQLPMRFEMGNAKIGTQTGRLAGAELTLADAPAGVALFGPYAALPAGRFVARIQLQPGVPLTGRAAMEVCARGASELITSRPCNMADASAEQPTLELPFVLDSARQDVEVRLINEANFCGTVLAVEIFHAA